MARFGGGGYGDGPGSGRGGGSLGGGHRGGGGGGGGEGGNRGRNKGRAKGRRARDAIAKAAKNTDAPVSEINLPQRDRGLLSTMMNTMMTKLGKTVGKFSPTVGRGLLSYKDHDFQGQQRGNGMGPGEGADRSVRSTKTASGENAVAYTGPNGEYRIYYEGTQPEGWVPYGQRSPGKTTPKTTPKTSPTVDTDAPPARTVPKKNAPQTRSLASIMSQTRIDPSTGEVKAIYKDKATNPLIESLLSRPGLVQPKERKRRSTRRQKLRDLIADA